MPRSVLMYLYDILQATDLLIQFTAGKALADYHADAMLRSAVERQFEIIGEALSQLARASPDVVERITQARQIIAFRNLLIHGYAVVDHRVVWDIVQHDLEPLRSQVSQLLASNT